MLYWEEQAPIIANHTLCMLLQHLFYSAKYDPINEFASFIEVTECFLSEELCGMIRNLLDLTGGSICVLEGMVKTLSSKSQGFAFKSTQAMHHVEVLVSFLINMLLDDKGTCHLTTDGDSGAVMKVLAYSILSTGWRYNMRPTNHQHQYDVPSDRIDSILVRVIEPMLSA